MKSAICLALTGLFVSITPVYADQGHGTKNFKTVSSPAKAETGAAVSPVQVKVMFSSRDVEVIRTHYASQHRSLPPGLQKKVARGGQLPPGWQKKMEPFPASLDRVLLPLPTGYKRGVYDGQAVIYDPLTHAIMDIVSLIV